MAEPRTQYAYNDAQQLDLVSRPDGKTIDYAYDAFGRLDTITVLPEMDLYDYGYLPLTGKLSSVSRPSGESLTFTYLGDRLATEADRWHKGPS